MSPAKMAAKRKIEVFSAGCPACIEVVEMVQRAACPSCEVIVLDMNDPPTLRHRPRRLRSAGLAQEAEGAGGLIFST
jgi:hypothetical protein